MLKFSAFIVIHPLSFAFAQQLPQRGHRVRVAPPYNIPMPLSR